MSETFTARDIKMGFHPEGYYINKNGSAMDYYTKWEITPKGKWTNPKPTCFDSMPQDGWYHGEKPQK